MDFTKLKLNNFDSYQVICSNKEEIIFPLMLSDSPDVFVSLCTNANDLMNTINFVQNNQQNKDNRLFIIFQKSQQKFNRNHIVNMISKHKRFHKKAPVIASLSKQYSVLTYMYEV